MSASKLHRSTKRVPAEPGALPAGAGKRAKSVGADAGGRPPPNIEDEELRCVDVDEGLSAAPAASGPPLLGSLRVDIMPSHPRHCPKSRFMFCYAKCAALKRMMGGAVVTAAPAPTEAEPNAIAMVVVGSGRTAGFGDTEAAAFAEGLAAGLVQLGVGRAPSWSEVDFDVYAGPSNAEGEVPPAVAACSGFERGVPASERTCDADCGCCY